jgi:amidophosphoribosyltransferase
MCATLSPEKCCASRAGIESLHFAAEKPLQQCIFEHVYFARPDSLVFGRVVEQSREMLGVCSRANIRAGRHRRARARFGRAGRDGIFAGIRRAVRMGLIRNHYVGRTFIEPQQSIRDFGVKLKLNPVRGNAARQARGAGGRFHRARHDQPQDRAHGARGRRGGSAHAHQLPADISPCYYGVDTPTREELIASDESACVPGSRRGTRSVCGQLDRARSVGSGQRSIEEIREYLGADSLGYLSLEAARAVDDTRGKFCTSCYTGVYPVDGERRANSNRRAHREASAPLPSWKFRWCRMNVKRHGGCRPSKTG